MTFLGIAREGDCGMRHAKLNLRRYLASLAHRLIPNLCPGTDGGGVTPIDTAILCPPSKTFSDNRGKSGVNQRFS